MNLKVILEPSEEGGFTVFVPALPGCVSEGDTHEEALANIREAISLYLEAVEDDRDFGPNAEELEIAI
jgi:predicted RNase H-like HicB family nuclease